MIILPVNFQDYSRDIIQHFPDFLVTETFLNEVHFRVSEDFSEEQVGKL